MNNEENKTQTPVRRFHAGNYVLTSLVAFSVTLVITRVFLQLTGFPQIGNSVLHIAHALWGGLLLIVAVFLPLAYANRWALQASALLGGIGIGLFIDEVGKFITQANDYFFPPALPLIYGFILLIALMYLYFRQPRQNDPRNAMYGALEGLKEALDGTLDTEQAARIEAQLTIAKRSDKDEIVSLANAIGDYLQMGKGHLSTTEPGLWKRITMRLEAFGLNLGRRLHRVIISVLLIVWVAFVTSYIFVLVQGGTSIDNQVLQWRGILIGIQILVGGLMTIALPIWLTGNEEHGLNFAVGGFILSLVALQTLYFYLSQFSAITATLIQIICLLILFTYRRLSLGDVKSKEMTKI